jgi:AcrR family transcriptional regulator
MQREEKSERSRRAVLDAALRLFSRKGYGATTIREIAEGAGVSTGNVYHHFNDKEAIFLALIDEYTEITESQRFPFTRALYAAEHFPDNIEQLGLAARESVRQYREYFALFYVDVIEFRGTHIRRFYAGMSERFTRFFEERGSLQAVQERLRPGVSPGIAISLTTRLFFNHFSLEILFGVSEPYGKDATTTIEEIADILRNGVCPRP